jgi:hypothetical protein
MPPTLAALGQVGERKRTPPAIVDPFPSEEAPTPVVRRPFGAGLSQTARTFRHYDALSDENKRLVDALVLALRATVDGGR